MKILLDTHAFIWFDSGDPKLSSNANQLILDPNNIVLLSVASILEMMIKVMAGKLTLREKVETLGRVDSKWGLLVNGGPLF